MKARLIVFALAVLGSGPAWSGTVVCSGTVDGISFHANNTFMVKLSSMNTAVFFCSPDGTFGVPGTSYTTGPETCKALVAMLIAARETGRTITGMYFDGDDVPASCNSWGNWKSANIRHFNY
jgi:hypothetical protein